MSLSASLSAPLFAPLSVSLYLFSLPLSVALCPTKQSAETNGELSCNGNGTAKHGLSEGGSDGSSDGSSARSTDGLTKQILALALPALVSLCVDPLMSAVDTAYIGRLGSDSGGGEVSLAVASAPFEI